MSKIILITDTHLGVRNGNQAILDHQLDFYENVLFKYMKQKKINAIFHLGDFFDTRSAISHKVIWTAKWFVEQLEQRDLIMHILVGNHDIPNKSDNNYDATSTLLKSDNVVVHDKNGKVSHFGFVPWVNKNNMEDFISYVEKTTAKYLFGHFDFLGAKFNKYDQISTHGIDPIIVKKFDKVFSGHFHTKSTIGNIEYLGSPFEYTWADWNDPKGFHVFDDVTGELEFIENPTKLFYKALIAADGSVAYTPPLKAGTCLSGKFVMVDSACTDKKLVKQICETIGEVEDLQVNIKPPELIIDEIVVKSIDTMLVDGVQSVTESRRHGVLKILQEAMDSVKSK
jgi:DNA repair exonuclease SbcCD nuclease subunit